MDYKITRDFYGPALVDLGLNSLGNLLERSKVKTDVIIGMSCPIHLRWFTGILNQPHDCLVDGDEAQFVAANNILKLNVDHNSMLKDGAVIDGILTSLRS